MSTTFQPSGITQGEMRQIRELYEERPVAELLDLDGTWTVKEIPLEDPNDTKAVVNELQSVRAIKKVGEREIERDDPSRKTRRINEYQFKESAREVLEQYLEDRETLPCGHRAHIHHRQEGGFGCRFCDDDPVFDRQVVEEALA